MKRIDKSMLLRVLNSAGVTTEWFAGTPNPETRDGVYVTARMGLANKTYFVGVDKTTGDFIIEIVG